MDESYIVDIFGVLGKDYSVEYFDNCMEHENIYKVLLEYDIIVLPSFRDSYSGVIIEALSIGMPTVTTTLCGISEIF